MRIPELIEVFLKHKKVAFISFLLCLFCSVLIYLLVPARYESEAVLLVGQGLNSRSTESAVEVRSALSSLAMIVLTDEVIGSAATKSGIVEPGLNGSKGDQQANSGRFEGFDVLERADSTVNSRAISRLRASTTVKADERADMLRVVFRYSNPNVAAAFVNALVGSLMSKQAELVGRPGAVAFFENQKVRFESEVKKASEELARFARETSMYSVDEQRRLLLKRASDLAASLASARGAIAERNGQKQALAAQLKKLKAVSNSTLVSQLVDNLGASGSEPNSRAPNPTPPDRSASADPPLLLVKVYQDGMAALLKIDAELAGYGKLEESIQDQIQKVNQELDALSEKEARYEQLKRHVSVTSASAEIFGKRTQEEEVSANISAARISSIRVVQPATKPADPVFPKLWMLLLMGVAAGTVVALGTVLVSHKYSEFASAYDEPTTDHSNDQLETSAIPATHAKPSLMERNRRLLRNVLNEVSESDVVQPTPKSDHVVSSPAVSTRSWGGA